MLLDAVLIKTFLAAISPSTEGIKVVEPTPSILVLNSL